MNKEPQIMNTVESLMSMVWAERGKYMKACETHCIRDMLRDEFKSEMPSHSIEWPFRVCNRDNCMDCKGLEAAPEYVTSGW